MRILIITDAWHPQVNGVVRSLEKTADGLEAMGHQVNLLTPAQFRSIPCPSYPGIRLALAGVRGVGRRIATADADAIHIATEGPLGLAARIYCRRRGLRFTTAYHTRFPEYLRARAPVPLRWSYAYLRWFHRPSAAVLVATHSLRGELARRGFTHLVPWGRGVDLEQFDPSRRRILPGARPILLYAGRVSVEKNLEDFLDLDVTGTKYVVGDGPDLARLKRRYPDAIFTGLRTGDALATLMASADVFVFPSRTDTLGLVVLEALASGVPVAAYPVTGPADLIEDGVTGALDDDLHRAVHRALSLDRIHCRPHVLVHSWASATQQFAAALVPVRALTAPASRHGMELPH